MKDIIIAIDGHSSCGKSSTAKALAQRFTYTYIDTGAMYRAVTLWAKQNNFIAENKTVNEQKLIESLDGITVDFRNGTICLNGEEVESKIRDMEITQLVSYVSRIKEVRSFLVSEQQAMGKDKGIVMDGRDIGSVVFPNAELKVFMTASVEVRAKRRWLELKEKGKEATFQEVLENLKERDEIDSSRKEAPLTKLPDSFVVDNSNLSFQEQVQLIENEAKKRMH